VFRFCQLTLLIRQEEFVALPLNKGLLGFTTCLGLYLVKTIHILLRWFWRTGNRTERQRSIVTLHAKGTEVMLLVERNFHLHKNPYDDEEFQKMVNILITLCLLDRGSS